MKSFISIFILTVFLGTAFPSPSIAAVSEWQKGASMISWGPEDFAQPWFHQSLANLRATHADHVALVIPYYQSTFRSWDIKAGVATPTDAALVSAITKAHELGFKVALKPHLQVLESLNGWRAYINPDDRTAWFAAYGAMLNKLGTLAAQHGVEQIVIGTELINMSDDSIHPMNTPGWKKMIAELRQVYDGSLTYSANWGGDGWHAEKDHVAFWGDLDYIGISAYFYMVPDSNNYTPAQLLEKWDFYNKNQIQPLAQKYGKQVLFTEVGYRSRTGALERPPRWEPGGSFDEAEQADGYEALFGYWDAQPHMKGVFIWDWENHPNNGGPGDIGFTPQNKRAQEVMTRWFGNGASPGEIASFQATAVPLAGLAQQTSTITTTINNLGSRIAAEVSLEVWNEEDVKVFNKVFSGEVFEQGQSRIFSADWRPDKGGRYRVAVGVFSTDWTKNYFWKELFTLEARTAISAGAGDIVIYASDVSTIQGNWSKVADATAAQGVRIKDPNNRVPKISVPSAAPQNYFEINFPAQAGVPYHLWMRMKADDNFYENDSVHVQFSDSVDASGKAIARIGTTESAVVILEEGSGNHPQSWGWNDNSYGGTGAPIYFKESGNHTLRIQQREDGISIDQILLSPTTFFSERPGLLKNDLTILARSAGDIPAPTPIPTPTSTPTASLPDTTAPVISVFSIEPAVVAPGSEITANFRVTDTGGSRLNVGELWRATLNSSGCNDSTLSGCVWSMRERKTAPAGSDLWEGNFADTPGEGVYYYGIHVNDGAGNMGSEPALVKLKAENPPPPPAPTSTVPNPTSTPPATPTSTPTSTAPAEPASTIDIWWPTDGSAITGTTPFKAMLQNWHVDDHDMFWQVDGDRLNGMYTSHEDWPHKEAWVDVSGWNWRENGYYLINFVAKNKQGSVIGEEAAVIKVAR